jgi:hypothetical protein
MNTILCPRCKISKEEQCFYYSDKKKRFLCYCKECFSEKRKERYEKNYLIEKKYASENRIKNYEYYKQYNKEYAKNNRQKIKDNQKRRYAENREYFLEYNKKYNQINRIKLLITKAKTRAKKLNLEFSIDETDLVLTELCPVLLIPYDLSGKQRWNSPSLDRIDNNKGYIKGNVAIISYKANSIKKDGTLEEFEKIVSFIENENINIIDFMDNKLAQQKARKLLNGARSGAIKRKIDYVLSASDKDILCKRVPLQCPMLGIDLSIDNNKRNKNSLSVDRIDNNKGYEIGNLIFCSFRANDLKSNASLEELKKIADYLKNNNK